MTWDLWVAVSQAAIYVAVAGAVGAFFCLVLWRQHTAMCGSETLCHPVSEEWLRDYGRWSAFMGLLLAPITFLLFIGSINQAGVRGMLDVDLAFFLLFDPPGLAALFQTLGFLLILAAMFRRLPLPASVLLYGIGLLMLLWSFTVRGHLAQEVWWVKALLLIHVCAFAMWAGALLPLWRISVSNQVHGWESLYGRFGHIAVWIVGALALAGIVMVVRILDHLSDLWMTPYGLALSFKLLLVGLLLLCAAVNKFMLVPALERKETNASQRLSRVIYAEMLCVMLIFSCTATFTVVIGYS
ncbi:copper resistance D family protein [Aliidiomarina sanyensis]|uniref:Copper resistance protein D n=1 Tax=Aliidiomarina sanyensis TaxID=1249555 RepID=A0A432WQ00_9GAMM|nr:CopD family protein [Aliidiomarina sanyensis]RUO35757.1 hypothetical protein CWE11_03090 [Aliidiomarina sanyensis]